MGVSMNDLIEALQIMSKYTDAVYPTHCEHDVLYVCFDNSEVSEEDRERLEVLGFEPNDDEGFLSYKFGSC
jgi:hypothetical protein